MQDTFSYISLPSLHDYNVKMPNFTFLIIIIIIIIVIIIIIIIIIIFNTYIALFL